MIQSIYKMNLFSKQRALSLGFVLLIVFIFFINTFHQSYPDEFDNVLGGWYTLHGGLIYKDWFTHHGPIAYWIAGFLEFFGGQSFVKFRYLYSLFLVLLTFGGFWYIRRNLGFAKSKFYLWLILLIGIASTYFWGHMLLADSLSGFLLLPVFGLLILKGFYKEKIILRDFVFIATFTSLSLLSTLTFSYLIAGIYLWTLIYYFFIQEKRKIWARESLKPFIILGFPYLLFVIYLILTGSLGDFIYQALIFNQKFYVYNYPRPEGSTFINPLRYATIIGQTFHNSFSSLLIGLPDFNFTFPFNISLAVVNASLLIYLILTRRFYLALFVSGFLIYSNVRSDPWTSKETDYQSAVYIMVSLFNTTFLLTSLYEYLKKNLEYPMKLILSLIFLLSLVYSFFNVAFILRMFSYKVYNKYMGTEARIYDRPRIAPIINSITTKEDFAYIGPFEFEELFYMHAKVPTKYQILIPGMGSSPNIQKEMLQEFSKNKPKVIYFDKRFFVLFRSPETYGLFFLNYLKENYMTVQEYSEANKIKLSSVLPIDAKIDLETKLYVNKEVIDQTIQELVNKNLIKVN